MTPPYHGDSPLPNVSKRNAESSPGTHGDIGGIGDISYSSASKSADSLRRSLYTEGKRAPSPTGLLLEKKIGKSVSYAKFTEQLQEQKGPENFSTTTTDSQWLESEKSTDYRYNEGGPFLKTEELNEKLTAFDEEIQQLHQQYEKLYNEASRSFDYKDPSAMKKDKAMMEETDKIAKRILQLREQWKSYWEVLKERGQKGQLQQENGAYYREQSIKELSETHGNENARMERRHKDEQKTYIQETLLKEGSRYGETDLRWENINGYLIKDVILEQKAPFLLQKQQMEQNKLQKKHAEEMKELKQELQKVSFPHN
ncbi:hypothetical protein ccbrp13_32330 [Ktedonobacteria bacterium brp13]|nr:hypothetical protein ccbrp13_32330 [Ktedonobacteria bacterium brp13]